MLIEIDIKEKMPFKGKAQKIQFLVINLIRLVWGLNGMKTVKLC